MNTVKSKTKIESYSSPYELAERIHANWFNFVSGDYTPPAIPSLLQFKSFIEIAYLATMEMEESRPTVFTLCCGNEVDVKSEYQHGITEIWPFETARAFNVQEIRRLSVALDSNSAAISVQFPKRNDAPLEIHGLLNLGASWTAARNAYSYFYQPMPRILIVRGLSPGYLVIYHGDYAVGQIKSGIIQVGITHTGFMDLFGAYPLFQAGHKSLRESIIVPKYEHVSEWHSFEWMAYVNVFFAIVNSINLQGHGGTLIISNHNFDILKKDLLKVKYLISSRKLHLREAFIKFMNLRHKYGDLEQQYKDSRSSAQLNDSFSNLVEAEKKLAENCLFSGKLSGVDGAILINSDLELQGFGTEIRLTNISADKKVYKVRQCTENHKEELDSEQFGMRHRSAIKLCSVYENVIVFVISQDRNISLVWNEGGSVYFKSDIKTSNLNMVSP